MTDIGGWSPHDGAETVWIDDHRIAFRDYQRSTRTSLLRVVDTNTGQDTHPPFLGLTTLGHNTHGNRVLLNAKKNAGDLVNRPPGIYELNADTGEIRPVFLQDEQASRILSRIPPENIKIPPAEWELQHSMYSPGGQKISFCIQTGDPAKKWLAIYTPGTDKLLFMRPEPLLHTLWYDNDHIVSHDREGARWTRPGILKLWKIGSDNGIPIGIPGNHLAVSPDGIHFASETAYHSNPVILRYFAKGTLNSKDARIITEHRFPEVTWGKSFHMNPAFSRDGKRLYYNKPLNNEISGTFVSDL